MDKKDEVKLEELLAELNQNIEEELGKAASEELNEQDTELVEEAQVQMDGEAIPETVVEEQLEELEETIRSEKKKKRIKTVKRVLKGVLITIELLLLLLVILVGSIVLTSDSKTEMLAKFSSNPFGRAIIRLVGSDLYDANIYAPGLDPGEIITNQNPNSTVLAEKYTTFAVFGIESYSADFDNWTHSDSIMIVSINNESKEVRIASVYRDTYLDIINRSNGAEDFYSKVNAAYFYGGALSAINTLNVNLDLNITDYATINWGGVSTVVDSFGGLDINLTDAEVRQINYHMGSTASGIGANVDYLESSGMNHLNGLQVTTYCRIRMANFYDPDTGEEITDDFGRAARQRYVIKLLVQKAKKAGISQLLDLAKVLLSNSTTEGSKIFETSLTMEEILDLIPVLLDFELGDTYGFPETKLTPTIDGASLVVAADLSYNVDLLHEFLYPDDTEYQVSDTVDDISHWISMYTGVGVIEKVTKEPEDYESEEDDWN